MGFGQPTGPPASRRQVETLSELLRAAGHSDFRDARGPLGLTQRQAGGKFTRDEADALIEHLEGEANAEAEVAAGLRVRTPEPEAAAEAAPRPLPRTAAATAASTNRRRTTLHDVPAEQLAAELQRRGWIVVEP